MREADYLQAVSVASGAAKRYLAAVAHRENPRDLVDLAMEARDRWAAVEMICALGEDAAQTRISESPWRHNRKICQAAWLDARHWAVRAEDAAARCQMAAALIQAHQGEAPTQQVPPPSLRSL
jgi:hypothetical protein